MEKLIFPNIFSLRNFLATSEMLDCLAEKKGAVFPVSKIEKCVGKHITVMK